MKKINGIKLCFFLSGLLFLLFFIDTAFDYVGYSATLNSAPFYVWIIMNVIYFIVPSIIALIVGLVLKKRSEKDK